MKYKITIEERHGNMWLMNIMDTDNDTDASGIGTDKEALKQSLIDELIEIERDS